MAQNKNQMNSTACPDPPGPLLRPKTDKKQLFDENGPWRTSAAPLTPIGAGRAYVNIVLPKDPQYMWRSLHALMRCDEMSTVCAGPLLGCRRGLLTLKFLSRVRSLLSRVTARPDADGREQ